MADVVNLRQFRKRSARDEAAKAAEENRARFGRSKADKAREKAEKASARNFLDGHRRDPRPTD